MSRNPMKRTYYFIPLSQDVNGFDISGRKESHMGRDDRKSDNRKIIPAEKQTPNPTDDGIVSISVRNDSNARNDNP